MKSRQIQKSVINDTATTMRIVIAAGKGAIKGYKKGGIPGAITGGVEGLITSIVEGQRPIGAI